MDLKSSWELNGSKHIQGDDKKYDVYWQGKMVTVEHILYYKLFED